MRGWCCPFLCFGIKREDSVASSNSSSFNCSNKGEEGDLLNESVEMENDDDLGVWDDFGRVDGVDEEDDELTLLLSGVGASESGGRRNKKIDVASDIGGGSNKTPQWISDMKSKCVGSSSIGSQGANMDVDLKLCKAGEPSSSTLSTAIESYDCDTQNKRPKVYPLSRDWGTNLENETHNLASPHEFVNQNVPECHVPGENSRSSDNTIMDDFEVRMDLTGDLLHMIFSFLGHIDLCRAARVCRQWRVASSHEDFWRYLNFENRCISPQQFEDMCRRYPNATAVNIHGTPAIHPLMITAVSSLRNLEVLTLGKSQLGETVFQTLTDCQMLRSLIVNDATLGNGIQEVPISHDRLHDLQLVKCRVLRISIRCPQLETLSLKRSSMPHVVLNCPLLQQLDIASCHKLTDAAIRSAAASCPLLESLDMSNCSSVTDESLREIAASCGNLRILDASYCPNISLESVRMQMLTVLKLHSCEGITSASMVAIAFSDMLEVLELDNCSFLTTVSLNLPRLKNIRLVHCRKFVELSLRSSVLSSITVSNCPSLRRISLTSYALTKLVLQKQESLATLALQCPSLQEVDLSECESLTNSICEVLSDGGGCPVLRFLVLDNCESLTAVTFTSSSLVSVSLGGCRTIYTLELKCPYLEYVSLDGCDHLERASFAPVGLKSLNMGICPKLYMLYVEAPLMVSLELKGCGVLSEAFIYCPLLTSLDASFCSQLKDDCLSATASSCPLIESLVLMSCPLVGADGLSSLHCLPNLTYLDLSYTFLVNLKPVFDSCLHLKVLKLQACKYLSDTSLEPLYKAGALPALSELDLSYGTPSQSAIEELLAGCVHLTSVSLNGCANMHDLDWGFLSGTTAFYDSLGSSSSSILIHQQRDRLLQNLNCVGCPNIKRMAIPPTARCVHLSFLNLSLSSNLKEVDISCSNLTLLNLSNCSSLEILKLDCPRLSSLFLQSCNIDGEAVEVAIKNCTMLETLDIRFCIKILATMMGTLRAACPSLKRICSSSLVQQPS